MKRKPGSVSILRAALVIIVSIQLLSVFFTPDEFGVQAAGAAVPGLVVTSTVTAGYLRSYSLRPAGASFVELYANVARMTLNWAALVLMCCLIIGFFPPPSRFRELGSHVHDYSQFMHTWLGASSVGWWASIAYFLALATAALPRPGVMGHGSALLENLTGPTWAMLALWALPLGLLVHYKYFAMMLDIPVLISAVLWTALVVASVAHSYLDCRKADLADQRRRAVVHRTCAEAQP